jgi:hypothetical protein
VSEYAILKRLLSDRPIAFHPALARVLGGINEALFFQQIAYWSDKGDDPEWIYKSQVELEEETCLSSYQQKQARDRLKRLGVLEDERRGVPARLYYRIRWGAIFRLLETGNLDSGPHSRFQETANLDSEEPGDLPTRNSQSISETTQREPEISFEASKALTIVDKYDDARLTLLPYVEDFAREFRDQATLTASTTRLVNLYRGSGLELDAFIDRMLVARAITQERTPAIRNLGNGPGQKSKMAYWFSVLTDLIGQDVEASRNAGD